MYCRIRDVDSKLTFGLITSAVLRYICDFVLPGLKQLSRFLFIDSDQ